MQITCGNKINDVINYIIDTGTYMIKKNGNKFLIDLNNSTIIVKDFINIDDGKIKIKIQFESTIDIITSGSCNPELREIDEINILTNTKNIKNLLEIINKINNDKTIFENENHYDIYTTAIKLSIDKINEKKFKYKKNLFTTKTIKS